MEIRNEGRSSAVSVWGSSDSVYQNDQSVSLCCFPVFLWTS